MIALAVVKYSPSVNPDRVFLAATVTGNYAQGGDVLNLNPATWTDPKMLGIVGLEVGRVPPVAPAPFEENLGGYYAEVVPGTTQSNFMTKFFAPGGAELAAGAYPAAILNGGLVFEVVF